MADPKLNAIYFAAVFLPGKLKKTTNGQKEVIVVHELIHAAGLNDWHDSVGIMFSTMQEEGFDCVAEVLVIDEPQRTIL